MTPGLFDEASVRWQQLEGVPDLWYFICDVDREKRIVDVLFKFAANAKIVLHRHHADYVTFTINGELRIYDAQGNLAETRPAGAYVSKAGGGEPHTEGGGDTDVVALFSNRNVNTIVYELLDADLNTIATLGLDEFNALFEAQKAATLQ